MNKKAVFYEATEPELQILRAEIARAPELAGWDIAFTPDKLTEETAGMAADAGVVSVFVNSRVSDAILAKLPALKLITTRTTGFDHIDCAGAKARNIVVTNVPAYGSRTVAEYAFALILALSRKIREADERTKAGHMDTSGLMGFDLQGKTIGVVGTGRIGQNVAQIAHGFDMRVLAYDAFPNEEAAAQIGFQYVPLDALLAASDVVSLHVPSNPQTKNLINSQNIGQFKWNSLLINTARGDVCETAAIIAGLSDGHLGGAGLDVVDGDQSGLRAFSNVIITPHAAYFSREAEGHICETTIANITAFAGGVPANLVND